MAEKKVDKNVIITVKNAKCNRLLKVMFHVIQWRVESCARVS